jgi:hypothetical protein
LCEPSQRLVLALACGFGAFCAGTAAFSLALEINLPAVWVWNLRNHAQFYEQYTRTYWKWLLVNPFELAFAAGLPVSVLAATGFGIASRRLRGGELAPYVAYAAVFGVLCISGKNMGEAARLWLFLQPWVLWLSAPCFESVGPALPADEPSCGAPFARRSSAGTAGPTGWIVLLVLQFLTCLASATRIDGFHLSEL